MVKLNVFMQSVLKKASLACYLMFFLSFQMFSQTGLEFNGSNQYVTFGAASSLGTAEFSVEIWFKRTGTGTSNTTGGSGITDMIPLISKGAPEAEGSTVDANYILGIQASTNFLAADFEEGGSSQTPA